MHALIAKRSSAVQCCFHDGALLLGTARVSAQATLILIIVGQTQVGTLANTPDKLESNSITIYFEPTSKANYVAPILSHGSNAQIRITQISFQSMHLLLKTL